MVKAAEKTAASRCRGENEDERYVDKDDPLVRVRVCDMGSDAQELCKTIIQERLIKIMSSDMRELSSSLFSRLKDYTALEEAVMSFATDEPTVNIYRDQALFEPHEDGYDLTMVVALNSSSEFDGGGTAFWGGSAGCRQGHEFSAEAESLGSVVLKPGAGTALLFSGTITHAGLPVHKGTRYTLVASFDLDSRG